MFNSSRVIQALKTTFIVLFSYTTVVAAETQEKPPKALFPKPESAQPFNFPGGVVTVNIAKQSNDIPEIKYGVTEPAIIDRGKYWSVIIGIGLKTLPGEYVVYVKHGIKGVSGLHKKIIIEHFNYPYLEVRSSQSAHFSDLYIEHNSLSSIDFSNTQQPDFPLQLPIKGAWSNHFGHSIKIGEQITLLKPNAVSLNTTQLTPVRAPQNAIVSKIETTKEGVNTVFLDHGRGLYSIIRGLSNLTVEVSNGIVAGAVIGTLVSNKNSTHSNNDKRLIWQTVMNGEYVNPLLLTKLTL